MFGFILKRKFVKDIQYLVYQSFERSSGGAFQFDNFTLNKQAFLNELEEWRALEKIQLDSLKPLGASEIGHAYHRATVWCGIFFVESFYMHGSIDVPKSIIKKLYKPSLIIADKYFDNLRNNIKKPFTCAIEDPYVLDSSKIAFDRAFI